MVARARRQARAAACLEFELWVVSGCSAVRGVDRGMHKGNMEQLLTEVLASTGLGNGDIDMAGISTRLDNAGRLDPRMGMEETTLISGKRAAG